VRELAYYTWNEEHGLHAFTIPVSHQNLSDKDKRTVNFIAQKIHFLTYQPLEAKHFQHPQILRLLVNDIYAMYKKCGDGKRTVVGYNLRHAEKDQLNKLGIPSLDLETLAGPQYEILESF